MRRWRRCQFFPPMARRMKAGDGEGEEDKPREEADLDEAAFEDVVDHARPDDPPLGDEFAGMAGAEADEGGGDVVAGEEEDVGGKMEGRVEEGVEAEHAAEADEEG